MQTHCTEKTIVRAKFNISSLNSKIHNIACESSKSTSEFEWFGGSVSRERVVSCFHEREGLYIDVYCSLSLYHLQNGSLPLLDSAHDSLSLLLTLFLFNKMAYLSTMKMYIFNPSLSLYQNAPWTIEFFQKCTLPTVHQFCCDHLNAKKCASTAIA